MKLPQKRKRAKLGLRVSGVVRCPAHLRWVRSLECCAQAMIVGACKARIEAHHVREGNPGMGTKPGDDDTVPLCAEHHSRGHSIGCKKFERQFSLDLSAIASELWRRSPARIAYERKMRKTP